MLVAIAWIYGCDIFVSSFLVFVHIFPELMRLYGAQLKVSSAKYPEISEEERLSAL